MSLTQQGPETNGSKSATEVRSQPATHGCLDLAFSRLDLIIN
jgi:hypothetical protein